MEFMNEAALGSVTPDHRSCKDLGVCQSRKLACADCPAKTSVLRLAPGVLDYGARRSHLDWLIADRGHTAWRLTRTLVIAGSITFTACLLAAKWGWL